MINRFIIITVILFEIGLSKDYFGAELRTKAAYTYGRFDVCFKASSASGQLSTFFLYHELGAGGTADWNEIDIEIMGRYDDNVQFNTITPGQTNHSRNQYVGFDPAADFHHYAIEWTPDYVAWFVDSVEVYRQTGAHISTLDKAQKIMMNIWQPVYVDWAGPFNADYLPQFAYYDWGQYSSYTPHEGNLGTGNNFTLQWRDDFESWDQNRWAQASHTWNGNNSDFTPTNVVFQEGKMILCLTDKTNPGYVDKNEPFISQARYINGNIEVTFSEEVLRETAGELANYSLSGETGELLGLQLTSNQRKVLLETKGLSPETKYTLFASNIEDHFGNVNIVSSKTVSMPTNQQFPMFINVGGERNLQYFADQHWKDNCFGSIGGTAYTIATDIQNTQEDIIFQNFINGIVEYKITVPNGEYELTLMLMENYFSSADQRLFQIGAEGQIIADSLDLYQKVGKNRAYYLKTPTVTVEDGILDIYFQEIKDVAVLNGIKLYQISTATKQAHARPAQYQLYQNYPNPFNSATVISYHLPHQAQIKIDIFDIQGQKVSSLIDKWQPAGTYRLKWQPPGSSGIYFYRCKIATGSSSYQTSKKMLYIK